MSFFIIVGVAMINISELNDTFGIVCNRYASSIQYKPLIGTNFIAIGPEKCMYILEN
jgi:hypothetical protein